MTVSFTGCYHATGIQRPPLIAEEVPSVLGDQVGGFKASAAPGDYYLGSDSIQLAVNGTPFSAQTAIPGAAPGGCILDIGDVTLDTNYHRSSTPSDRLERLSTVINQDPDLPLVFTSFQVSNNASQSSIAMQGGLYDPQHKVKGATWDSLNRVSGVSATHTISLANLQNYVTLTTTLVNKGSAHLPIYNLGDYVFQQGGGFRFNIPAYQDYDGNPLNNWGVEIPDHAGVDSQNAPIVNPGTSFGEPYKGVKARMVGLMGSEPAGDMDYHCSLGFLPVSDNDLLITSDPQHVFNEPRPVVTPHLVVGSIPRTPIAGTPVTYPTLNPGESITYTRRLYLIGGNSTGYAIGYYGQTLGQANQATGLFNVMSMDSYTLQATEFGSTVFYLDGSAQVSGPLQTEIRIEKYTGGKDPLVKTDTTNTDGTANYVLDYAQAAEYLSDNDPAHWVLERTEWLEPDDFYTATNHAPGHLGIILPAGTTKDHAYYRIAFRNRNNPTPIAPPWIYSTPTSDASVNHFMPLWVQSGLAFQTISLSNLCPEYDEVVTGGLTFSINGQTKSVGGTMTKQKFMEVPVSARSSSDSGGSSWQPMRVSVFLDESQDPETKAPNFPRARTLGGLFNPSTHRKDFTGANLGVNGFIGGNQAFGSSLSTGLWLQNGSYTLYGTRGPLSALYVQTAKVDMTQSNLGNQFVVYQDPLPHGWTSFDLPGPSQITTGGYIPLEKLSSALAEGIQVVANTEMDRLTSATNMQVDFRSEFEYAGSTDAERMAVQFDPFVIGARSTVLNGFGTATALFTPEPRNERGGGARDSSTWSLADFQLQAEGQFTIVHRPRGPQGLFTLKNFTPGVVSDPNSWWNAHGHIVNGTTNGSFDAIELLRGESWDPTQPDAWFTEFKTLRNDWFGILNQQTPTQFTKALGLSSAIFSVDTPVGMARTYVKAQGYTTTRTSGFNQSDMSAFQTALKTGAAVASTGPLLDVTLTGVNSTAVPATQTAAVAPGGLLTLPAGDTVTLTVNLWFPDWVPVEELRAVINGGTPILLDINQLVLAPAKDATATEAAEPADWRHFTATYTLPMPSKDAWVVVEAGAPLSTTGSYQAGSELWKSWNRVMKGLYPIAITNPIFVDVNGGGYTAPGL